jgi:hypothetical protein
MTTINTTNEIPNGTNDNSIGNHMETFQLRPSYKNKFKPAEVKEIIRQVMNEKFKVANDYQIEQIAAWTKDISNLVRDRCTELKYERYKFVVNVLFGEQRGAGVKMGCRCFWDDDCDNYACDTFMNNSFFCVVTVYGIYCY